MSRAALSVVSLATFAGIACASATASKTASVPSPSRAELAYEVAQRGVTEEQYRSLLTAYGRMFQVGFERLAAKEGKKIPPRFMSIVTEVFGEEIPYSSYVRIMADFYERNFTQAELNEMLAIRETAVYQKEMRLAIKLTTEAGQRVQERLLARRREIESKVLMRLALETRQPPG